MEVERARLTRRLAQIQEEQGNISEAAKILQDQQVETFGSMEKREKVEFILEQMRLCLANHDYVRTQIISKKISVRFFDTESVQVILVLINIVYTVPFQIFKMTCEMHICIGVAYDPVTKH